ncbi:MAG TPA: hypothetical protein PLN61_17370 [bacterium]|nr:hypothetical protein [bacterium]
MQEKKYEIDGRTFYQRPLVLGQVRQLLDLMQGVTIPVGAGAMGIIDALGEKLPMALAIVLTEADRPLRDKDLHVLAQELTYSVTPETALEVVEHFFGLNPIASLLSRIGNLAEKIGAALPANDETPPTT